MPETIQHICMADDDPDDYYLFKTALSEVDDAVKLNGFSSCNSILEYLKSSTQLPDIIVLDMNMPGNDGNKCLLAIKKEARLHHIPVVIYSTSGTPDTMERAKACGAFDYILKAPSIHLTKEIIAKMLTIPTGELTEEAIGENKTGEG
jgi:DNA-binding NtrC family response regulator